MISRLFSPPSSVCEPEPDLPAWLVSRDRVTAGGGAEASSLGKRHDVTCPWRRRWRPETESGWERGGVAPRRLTTWRAAAACRRVEVAAPDAWRLAVGRRDLIKKNALAFAR